jgi:hypothetical protein
LLLILIVHPFSGDPTAAAQSSVRWIATTATPPDAVSERMTGLLRESIGRVLTLSPPESLTTAAAREALRSADASQTLFLVTDGATLSDLMSMDGWQYMSRAGLELVNPRIWGRTLYVFARTGLDSRLPLKGWIRWAGSTSPDVRDRAAAVMRRLGYVNVTFETMNATARMVDAFNRGGSAGGVDIVCIYDEEPSSTVDSFVTGVTGAKTGVRLLLLEPETNQLLVEGGVPAATMPYSAQRFYAWPAGVSLSATAPNSSVVVTPPPGAAPANEARLPLFLTNARRRKTLPNRKRLEDRTRSRGQPGLLARAVRIGCEPVQRTRSGVGRTVQDGAAQLVLRQPRRSLCRRRADRASRVREADADRRARLGGSRDRAQKDAGR